MINNTTDKGLVHVVDDEEAIRKSLKFLLGTAGYRVERWPDGETFLKGVNKSVDACVLLDIRMPGIEGLDVQKQMVEVGINFPVIVLTGHGDVSQAVRAMQAGAMDFLEKPFDRDRLLDAVEASFQQIADREALWERAHWARTQIAKLTEREREVLDGLASGLPNKTIAYDLGISSRTVEVYRANVMSKLAVANFADALRVAFAAGFGSEHKWCAGHGGGPKQDTA
jgi:two-component system response regulator FixJ